LPGPPARNDQVNPAKEDPVPHIFVLAAVGKAIAFIIIILILAVIGFFTLVKKAL
jgi:hypothetical protein